MGNDPLEFPSTAYRTLDEKRYKAELELVGHYQEFTTELLRLALLGIAAFGFLFKEVFIKCDPAKCVAVTDIGSARWPATIGIVFFGAASFFALAFRYLSSETARLYIEGLRYSENDQEAKAQLKLGRRGKVLTACMVLKALAATTLALGAIAISIAVTLLWAGPATK